MNITILKLPHTYDLDEFDPLAKSEDVRLSHVTPDNDPGDPDLLIIPDTSNSIKDMEYLNRSGYANKIRMLAKKGCSIFGISGGFQMLGTKIIDIKGSEYGLSRCEGLGFLNIVTRIMPSMTESKVECKFNGCASLTGFERHLGKTRYLKGSNPAFTITKRHDIEVEIPDGAINETGSIMGTYIHGIFDNDSFKEKFLHTHLHRRR